MSTLKLVFQVCEYHQRHCCLPCFFFFFVRRTPADTQVIPFLVLAIGVDNLFILVNKYQDLSSSRPDDSVVDLIGSSVGRCGASITLAAMSESLAFFLGALTDMPAVRAFALFAGCAVLANYFLQMTLLVAVLTLDARRQKVCLYSVYASMCFRVYTFICMFVQICK